jgi:hypothetical protein
VVKLETNTGNTYYFLKNGSVPYIPDPFYKFNNYNNNKNWEIYFKVKKSDNVQNKWFKLIVQDYRAKNANELIDSKTDYFTVDSIEYVKISNYSISKVSETNDFVDYVMNIALTKKPKVLKIETENANAYYFVKNGYIQAKPNFVTSMSYSSDYTNWTINFRIYKSDSQQTKTFKLIVQDMRALSANEYVDSKQISFIVPAKDPNKSSVHVTADSYYKQVPAKFIFTVKTDYKVDALKVVTSKGESSTRIRTGYGTFGAIQITPLDDLTWKVTYNVYSLYPYNARENKIKLTFYTLTKDLKTVLSQTSVEVTAYRDTSNEDFTDILNFINKSPVIAKLNLGDTKIRYAPISRAEAALIVYEFLKLKNPNFNLPYDIEFYSNPFADLDENTSYYNAVITLANYKGDDNITVLTKKFGVFNPLDYVKRFQFVKMIIEGLNIPKTNDFSYIQNYDDYSILGDDAKIYFATAVKNGIIHGDNNRLLAYDKLTVFQALTILDRVKDYNFTVSEDQFDFPQFDQKIGDSLGIIPDYQNYNPNITPIKINGIKILKKDENCTTLAVDATVDKNATGYYTWSANFGYFKKLDYNNKEVIFCRATKKPDIDYQIKVMGNDGYFNFDEKTLIIKKDEFKYPLNIAETNSSVVRFDLSLSLPDKTMKENSLFVIDKKGSLYKNNLKVGLEKVSVVLIDGANSYTVDNVKWNDYKIYFVVPTVKEFYGKTLNMEVVVGSNGEFKSFDFSNIVYHPVYAINGYVAPDENGTFPKSVYINNQSVNVNAGNFYYFPDMAGEYNISVNKPHYDSLDVKLTDEDPVANVYLGYNLPLPPDINITYPVEDINQTASEDTNQTTQDQSAYSDINQSIDNNQTISDNNQSENNSTNPIENNTTQTITAFDPVTGNKKEFNSTKEIPSNWMQGEPVIVNIKKGISLVSGNMDFRYLPKNVLIVWSINPKTKEWEAYSPIKSIQEKIIKNGFRLIEKIDASRGFFVVAKDDTKLVTYESIDTNDSIDIMNLPDGYSLIGSSNMEIGVDEIGCKSGYKVGGVFKYKNGTWQKVIPSINRYDFRFIEQNEGALVQCIPQGSKK